MKIIVPLAGKGTRLLPLTKRVPKPLVKVAGRPVMDYVMDAVAGFDVDELIVITGHLKDQVERYITTHYNVRARFVEQKQLDGTAGATAFISDGTIRATNGAMIQFGPSEGGFSGNGAVVADANSIVQSVSSVAVNQGPVSGAGTFSALTGSNTSAFTPSACSSPWM